MFFHHFSAAEFKQYLSKKQVYVTAYSTSAGVLYVLFTNDGIYQANFEKPHGILQEKQLERFDTFLLVGTLFQRTVWQMLAQCNDEQLTYEQLATLVGKPKAHRAVANALARNNIAYFIPCHKVIRKDGSLGAFKWGLEKKRLLRS